jgi:hypothetical protein
MACQTFTERRFQKSTLVKIEQANAIIGDYLPRGFRLTIRQLHYQFVARGLYENTERSYKNLINTMRDARLAGLVDWAAIEDRTRTLQGGRGGWDGPADFIADMIEQYADDWWQGQPYRPEVWIEKAALLGVIEDVCERYGVRYYASRGDDSKSPSYDAGKRFARILDQGQIPLVLHLADHDPKGVHFTPFIREELAMFAGADIEVRRLALTMEQVEEHNPPPNFAKETDTLYARYCCYSASDALRAARSGPAIDSQIPAGVDANAKIALELAVGTWHAANS